MATIRRLSDEDVKAVFDCVHNNRPPPADLPFHLVNVGPNGLKLSPPSFEFEGTTRPSGPSCRWEAFLVAYYFTFLLCSNIYPCVQINAILFLCFWLDGLYVLLRPIKKRGKKDKDAPVEPVDPLSHPSIPSNLMDQVMTEYPTGTCPWSLSGPQFPQPTAIQQRYCYPKVRI